MIERERERDLTLLTQLTEIFFNGSMFFFFLKGWLDPLVGRVGTTIYTSIQSINLYIYTSVHSVIQRQGRDYDFSDIERDVHER